MSPTIECRVGYCSNVTKNRVRMNPTRSAYSPHLPNGARSWNIASCDKRTPTPSFNATPFPFERPCYAVKREKSAKEKEKGRKGGKNEERKRRETRVWRERVYAATVILVLFAQTFAGRLSLSNVPLVFRAYRRIDSATRSHASNFPRGFLRVPRLPFRLPCRHSTRPARI